MVRRGKKSGAHRAEMARRRERRDERSANTAAEGPSPTRKKPRPETTDVKARKHAAEDTKRRRMKRLSDAAAGGWKR